MSSKGNCYDNAAVESLFGTLKCETIYLSKIKTLGELISTIENYIKNKINFRRLFSRTI